MNPKQYALVTAVLLPQIAMGGFEVSSFKQVNRTGSGSPYAVSSALDSNPATAWQVDPEQKNEGQWISVDVPMGTVNKITVVTGWAESDEVWADHARLKAGRVEIYSSAGGSEKLLLEQAVSFKDSQAKQVIDLTDTKVGDALNGGRIKLVVTEVYPGKDYANLALGEFLVYLTEFDVAAKALQIKSASSEVEGHDGTMAIDGSSRTYWQAAADADTPMLTIDHGRYAVSRVGLKPGPKGTARAKRVEIGQGGVMRTFDVPDTDDTTWFELPALVGYTGSGYGDVTVKVLETHQPGAVALSEITFKATQLDPF